MYVFVSEKEKVGEKGDRRNRSVQCHSPTATTNSQKHSLKIQEGQFHTLTNSQKHSLKLAYPC